MPTAIPFASAKKLASLIRRRKIGCLELVDLYLERVSMRLSSSTTNVHASAQERRIGPQYGDLQ
jgi:hypothetical protein